MSKCSICKQEANTQKLYIRTREDNKRSWVAIGDICNKCIALPEAPQEPPVEANTDPHPNDNCDPPPPENVAASKPKNKAFKTADNINDKKKVDYCIMYNDIRPICRNCDETKAKDRVCCA